MDQPQNSNGKKIAIYSAVFQSFEPIPLPLPGPNALWDSYVFTDGTVEKPKQGVTVIKTDFRHKNPRMTAKYFKVNPHVFFENYEYSLYIDGNCALMPAISDLLNQLITEKHAFALFPHSKRTCVYDELKYVFLTGKENIANIARVWLHFKRHQYPRENGLIQGGFLWRQHNASQVIQLMTKWWSLINQYSERDQLTLDFLSWQLGVPIHRLHSFILHESPYTQIVPHASVQFDEQGNQSKNLMAKAVSWYNAILRN